jgi:hypothetical protein
VHVALVYWVWNAFTFLLKGVARLYKQEKETYGFELRFGDASGIFGVALALRGCFCSVAHDCDVFCVYVGGVECGDAVVWRFVFDRDCDC